MRLTQSFAPRPRSAHAGFTLGHETTSTYQARYRATLAARGLWTPLAAAPDSDRVDIIVRPARGAPGPPAGYMEFFRDDRFVACVRR